MLKLYSWGQVRCDYTCGSIYVVASSAAAARSHLLNKWGVKVDEEGQVIDPDYEHPDARTVMYNDPFIEDITDGLIITCDGSA